MNLDYAVPTDARWIINISLAECVALWGEPEQAVHGMKERRAAACSDMKGKRAIRLVVAFVLTRTPYVILVGGGCARGVYSHTSDLRCLSS